MTKPRHRRVVWNKKTGKMLPPKAMDATEGHRGLTENTPEQNDLKKFRLNLKKQVKNVAKK